LNIVVRPFKSEENQVQNKKNKCKLSMF